MSDAKPSKSARKREQQELQSLGERLIGVDAAELKRLISDETLRNAIVTAKDIRSHGALRRQRQLIGKLMNRVDIAPLRDYFAIGDATERRTRQVFHQAETWRDRIVRDGNAGIERFEAVSGAQETELRSLYSDLRQTYNERTEKHLKKQLFRLLHDKLKLAGDSSA